MMKKYLLKIAGLLFLCGMVFSCEKDNFVDDLQKLDRQNDIIVKIIGEKEVKANKKLSDILQKLKNPPKDNQGRGIHSSEYGFTVYTERAKYAKTDSTHSYSFYISMDNPENNNLKNLVLSSNENEGYDVFVVHYALTSDEFENVDIGMFKAAPHTVTRLEEFDYSEIFSGNSTARQVYACIEVIAIVDVDCDEGQLDGDIDRCNDAVLLYSDCGFYDNGSGGGGDDGGNSGDSGSEDGGYDTGGGSDGNGAPYNGENQHEEMGPDKDEVDPDIVIVVPVLEPEEDCNTFEERVEDVLNTEGGFVNDPADPGGATNKGITWGVWQDNAMDIVGVSPTLQNLQNLTDAQAKLIYKTLYWDKVLADDINDGDLRFMLFDFFVNAGGNAVKVLQNTLNDLGGNVSVDGAMGTQTLNAINNYPDQIELYNTFKDERQAYYDRITQRSVDRYLQKHPQATQSELTNNTFKKFINGWTNRVEEFENKTQEDPTNVNC